jgi:predicted acylesterase/phospholipase RssA
MTTADDFKAEIREILDRGPPDDDWPEMQAEAEALADELVVHWRRLRGGSGPFELDVVCSGGGWRNMYCGGSYALLSALEEVGIVKVKRAAGASSGALAAGCLGCRCPPRDWYRLHDAWWILHKRHGLRLYNAVMRGFIRAFYPADAHARCTKRNTRFSISDCHEFPYGWPQRVLASNFTSWADFEESILASCALPFVIGTPFFLHWRGRRCLDGGVCDNCPAFDDHLRPQLIVDLHRLKSPAAEMHLLPDRARLRELWRAGQNDCASILGQVFDPSQSKQPMTATIVPADAGAAMRLTTPGYLSEVDNSTSWMSQWAHGALVCLEIPPILAVLFCARYGPMVLVSLVLLIWVVVGWFRGHDGSL